MPEALSRSPVETESICPSLEVQRISFYANISATTSLVTTIGHSTMRKRIFKMSYPAVDPNREMQHTTIKSHVGRDLQVGEREKRLGTWHWHSRWPHLSLTAAYRVRGPRETRRSGEAPATLPSQLADLLIETSSGRKGKDKKGRCSVAQPSHPATRITSLSSCQFVTGGARRGY